MAEQTISQRRFTVLPLPVLSIVRETLLLPLKFLPELLKFGGRPLILYLAADVFCYGLLREDVSRGATSSLMGIAHFVLFTAVLGGLDQARDSGPQAVAKHPRFAYSRTQWLYLLATAVMSVAMVACVGIPFIVMRYGHEVLTSR